MIYVAYLSVRTLWMAPYVFFILIQKNDLEKISSWAFQWKMSLNPDINKQAQEVIFSRKLQKSNHPSLIFDGTSVTQSEIQIQKLKNISGFKT